MDFIRINIINKQIIINNHIIDNKITKSQEDKIFNHNNLKLKVLNNNKILIQMEKSKIFL